MRPVTVKDGDNRQNPHETRIQSFKGKTNLHRGNGPGCESWHHALRQHGSLEANPACLTKMRSYFSPTPPLGSEVPTSSESLGVFVFFWYEEPRRDWARIIRTLQ